MITIIDNRNSGKTKKLLQAAHENNGIIITQDKRAFQVKARSYGYSDVKIFDYNDLAQDNYPLDAPVFIHNGDKMLYWILDKYYNLNLMGFTATVEDN